MNSGSVVRDYHITSLLGIGGMGEVYLAEEAMLGRKVAIKRLNPLLTNDAQFSERFINEARIQAKLQHHNIVSLYNFFVEDGVYYMVMEYAPGITLKELIAQTGPIPEQRTLNIFKQIVDALGYAHAKEIIHRDIKPSNVLIDADDKVKIMDFGIARLLSDKHLTQTGAKVGTLFYMSPEQVKAAKDIDHRTDIYSAGIVLYEMLTGTLPFKADTDSDFEIMMEIVNHDIPNPREVYPHISDKTVATLNKAAHKVREQRYQNCKELDKALLSIGDYSDSTIISGKSQTIESTQKSVQNATSSPSLSGEELTPIDKKDELRRKCEEFEFWSESLWSTILVSSASALGFQTWAGIVAHEQIFPVSLYMILIMVFYLCLLILNTVPMLCCITSWVKRSKANSAYKDGSYESCYNLKLASLSDFKAGEEIFRQCYFLITVVGIGICLFLANLGFI